MGNCSSDPGPGAKLGHRGPLRTDLRSVNVALARTPVNAASPPSTDAAELVHALARESVGLDPRVVEMPGGASTRRYFRVTAGDRSAVAMYVPDLAPEEVSKEGVRERWPFLEVAELLAGRGVRVPAVLAEHCDRGVIFIEDLGDATLAACLESRPELELELYQRAVADLARAHEVLADLPEHSVVRTRAFDRDLLHWEVHHFREWALEARGVQLNVEQRKVFDRAADYLAETIASWSRGFVHRDYQSRNLMVCERAGARELVWIDFQDALLGPRVYDLVALLNDSYRTFSRQFVEARLGEFAALRGIEPAELIREFDMVTVQRKLKDAGRFVFIERKKGDASYLRFVEPTIAKVSASLERITDVPELGALAALLDRP